MWKTGSFSSVASNKFLAIGHGAPTGVPFIAKDVFKLHSVQDSHFGKWGLFERLKRCIEDSRSAPRRWRLRKQQTTRWLAFREVHGEDSISISVNLIQSWSQDVIFSKFHDWQSYDRESFPRATFANTNVFLSLIESFPIGPVRENKQIDLFGLPLNDHNLSEKLELLTTQQV